MAVVGAVTVLSPVILSGHDTVDASEPETDKAPTVSYIEPNETTVTILQSAVEQAPSPDTADRPSSQNSSGLGEGSAAQLEMAAAAFEGEICPNPDMSNLFGGLLDDTIVRAMPAEYFTAVSQHYNWDFTPRALFAANGEIRIDRLYCLRLSMPADYSPLSTMAWETLVHEAAHALDAAHDWQLSAIDFPVTGLGHSDRAAQGERELFAFCIEKAVFTEPSRDRCPDANYEAALSSLASIADISPVALASGITG